MMKIALAQTTLSTSPQENLETAHRFFELVAGTGVDLLVFPEMFMALPQRGVRLSAVAEPLDGPFVGALARLARNYRVGSVFGIWEQSDEHPDKAINSAVAVDRHGATVACYHKIHLFDALSVHESENMVGGIDPPPIFPLARMQVGLAICYDLRFPELFRYLVRLGADVVIVPSAWYGGPMKEEHWLTLLKARAIENTCYVVGVTACGNPFSGRSAIFDPFGVMLAGAGEDEELVISTLRRERIDAVREKLPVLQHTRPHLFRE